MCYVATPDEVIYQHQPLNSLASPPRQAAPDPQLCGGGIQQGSQPGAAQSAARGSSLVAPQQSVAQGPYCGVGVGAAAATAAAAVPYYGPPPAWPPPQSGPPPVPAPEEPAGAAGAGEPGPRRLPPAGTPPRFPPADAPPCPSREAWTAPGLGQGWAESDAPGPELPPAGAAAAAASAAPGGAQRPLAASEGGAAGPPGPRREAQAPILRPAPGLRRGWAESSPERPPAGAAAAGAAGALWWTVHAKTLSSTDKDVVSQPFELDVAGPVHFKLGLFPRSTCDARLNASFRRAKGRGRVTLMCTDPVRARTRVQFRIAVGSASSESQEPRGPVTHDFFENRVAGLPTGSDEWDFKKIADASTETFTVLLEVAKWAVALAEAALSEAALPMPGAPVQSTRPTAGALQFAAAQDGAAGHAPADAVISTCRICLEEGRVDADLIAPCVCRGSAKHVHLACLEAAFSARGALLDLT
ncbi:unnamed protein product [Prorocentrum cordatum]|uniref:RING-CH-type domain-containing protein n=1 Tax=Prorocentrum cordatum TaxID=2364126 RepID=A0ABN9XC23_9DINO|nr:unnamed protein product [Polarella glacialis]